VGELASGRASWRELAGESVSARVRAGRAGRTLGSTGSVNKRRAEL